MKNRYIIFFVIVNIICQTCNSIACRVSGQVANGYCILVFEESVFDFGDVSEKDGIISHDFYFKNTSNEPFVINKIISGCKCIGYNYPKEPIMQGNENKVTVTYDPSYRKGFFSKEIVIFTNQQKNPVRIWIKGNVIPFDHPVEEDYPYNFGSGLHLSLKVLAFGKITPGTVKTLKLRYANDTDKKMTLNFKVESNDQEIQFVNPGTISPFGRGEMTFSYIMPKSNKVLHELIINIYAVVNGVTLSQPLQAKISTTTNASC